MKSTIEEMRFRQFMVNYSAIKPALGSGWLLGRPFITYDNMCAVNMNSCDLYNGSLVARVGLAVVGENGRMTTKVVNIYDVKQLKNNIYVFDNIICQSCETNTASPMEGRFYTCFEHKCRNCLGQFDMHEVRPEVLDGITKSGMSVYKLHPRWRWTK